MGIVLLFNSWVSSTFVVSNSSACWKWVRLGKCMHGVSGNDFGELGSTVQCKENEETSSGWLPDRQKRGPLLVDLIFQQNPENWFYVKISQSLTVAQTFWTIWVNQNTSFLLHLSPNWWISVSIPSWTFSSAEDIFKGSPFCLLTVVII